MPATISFAFLVARPVICSRPGRAGNPKPEGRPAFAKKRFGAASRNPKPEIRNQSKQLEDLADR